MHTHHLGHRRGHAAVIRPATAGNTRAGRLHAPSPPAWPIAHRPTSTTELPAALAADSWAPSPMPSRAYVLRLATTDLARHSIRLIENIEAAVTAC
ncbi:hypothetical protein ACRAWF_40490 [Streptomyces sp. L7]